MCGQSPTFLLGKKKKTPMTISRILWVGEGVVGADFYKIQVYNKCTPCSVKKDNILELPKEKLLLKQ
jgi:hypothetical protein